ncbi:hypothetical protein Tco_0553515 [Tanacetum coccineum]
MYTFVLPFLAEGPRGGQGEADGHSWGQLSFYVNDVGNPKRNHQRATRSMFHTFTGCIQDHEGSRCIDRYEGASRRRCEHTTAEIIAMAELDRTVDRSRDVDFMMWLVVARNRFRGCFCSVYDSGGASGSVLVDGGGRVIREDGDDTRGEDGGDDTS